jgi:hypothetical protein
MIPQTHYPNIEFDLAEKDIIQIWQRGEVIQIERENIPELIKILQKI